MSDFPPPPEPPSGYQQYGYGYGPGAAYSPATFWQRVGATLLDGLIIGIPLNLLLFNADPLAGFVLRLLVGAVYSITLEGGPSGATLGKRVMSIKVVDQVSIQAGIGSGRATGRYFAKYLSGLALGLGYLWMLWDGQKQTWHDKLTGTRVVRSA